MLGHRELGYMLSGITSSNAFIGTVTANKKTLETFLDDTIVFDVGGVGSQLIEELGNHDKDTVNIMMSFLSTRNTRLNYNEIAIKASQKGKKHLVRELARYGAYFSENTPNIQHELPIFRVRLNHTMMRNDESLRFTPYLRPFARITAYVLMDAQPNYPIESLLVDIISVPKGTPKFNVALEAFGCLVRSNYIRNWQPYLQLIIDKSLTRHIAILLEYGLKVSTLVEGTPFIALVIGKGLTDDDVARLLVDSSGGLNKTDDQTLISQIRDIISRTNKLNDVFKERMLYSIKINIDQKRRQIDFFKDGSDFEEIDYNKIKQIVEEAKRKAGITTADKNDPAEAAKSGPNEPAEAANSGPTKPARTTKRQVVKGGGAQAAKTGKEEEDEDEESEMDVDLRALYEGREVSDAIFEVIESALSNDEVEKRQTGVFITCRVPLGLSHKEEEEFIKQRKYYETTTDAIKGSVLLHNFFEDDDEAGVENKLIIDSEHCDDNVIPTYIAFATETMEVRTKDKSNYDNSRSTARAVIGSLGWKRLLELLTFAVYLDDDYLAHHIGTLYGEMTDKLSVKQVKKLISMDNEVASQKLLASMTNNDGFNNI